MVGRKPLGADGKGFLCSFDLPSALDIFFYLLPATVSKAMGSFSFTSSVWLLLLSFILYFFLLEADQMLSGVCRFWVRGPNIPVYMEQYWLPAWLFFSYFYHTLFLEGRKLSVFFC